MYNEIKSPLKKLKQLREQVNQDVSARLKLLNYKPNQILGLGILDGSFSVYKFDGISAVNTPYKFIKYIEEIEERFEQSPSQFNLLDLLFTLIANEKKAQELLSTMPDIIFKIDMLEYIVKGKVDVRLKLLRGLLTNLKAVFDYRNFGELEDSTHKLTSTQIEDNEDKNPYNDTLKRGSLMYFLTESHSTSRRTLHPKVKEFLKRLGAKR